MDFTPSTFLIIIATVVISILWSLLESSAFLPLLEFAGLKNRDEKTREDVTARDVDAGDEKRMATSEPEFDPNFYSKSLAGDSPSKPVFFQWNGHSFEAFEALGLPTGSSQALVEDAFQRMTASTDAQSMLFFKAAYDAILKRL